MGGEYRPKWWLGRPNGDIILNPISESYEYTVVHELGHCIDYMLLGKRGILATDEEMPEMAKWYEAVTNSRTFMNLVRDVADVAEGEAKKRAENFAFTRTELFARSYAQWIATRTGDETILRQIAARRDSEYVVERYAQWPSDDFEAIGEALDELFRAKGWLKE